MAVNNIIKRIQNIMRSDAGINGDALKDADIFDIICHVAFDQPPLTRKERANILEIPPFNKIGKPSKIIQLFGGFAGYEQAIKELEEEIYKTA